MKSILAIILLSLIAVDAGPSGPKPSGQKKIHGCYFTNWSQYRPGAARYLPESYEPGLCSHIFFAFVGMSEDFKLEPLEKNDLDGVSNGKPVLGLYHQINDLKRKQPGLVTLLSFGGYLFGQEKGELMLKMIANKDSRQIFIADVIRVVRKYRFDGFDVNWYPTAEAKDNFVLLVKEMREAFEKEKIVSKLPALKLSAAVPPVVERIRAGYDGKALSGSLHYFHVMAFDYHGPWESQTGFNTPVFDNGDGLSINATIRHLIDEQRIPAQQLLLGLATYGHGWTIPGNAVPNQIPSPALGPSPPGPVTNTSGVYAYYEICSMIENDGFVVTWDDTAQGPFAYKKGVSDGIWVAYDNIKSHGAELTFACENKLAGAFVWTLDQDDFDGHCKSSNGKYPLIKAARDRLAKEDAKKLP